MRNKLTIVLSDTTYPWQISARVNDVQARIQGRDIVAEFDFMSENIIRIDFDGKDAVQYPDMTVRLTRMYLDYIEITPLLYEGTHATDHPDYPKIQPCTDINLNGSWSLTFNSASLTRILSQYLGISNEF